MIDDKSFIAARAKFSSAFMSISVKQTTVVGLLFEGLDECSCPIRRPWQVLSSTMILFLLGWLIGWFELVSLHFGGCDCLCYYYWVRKTFWATQTTSRPLDCIVSSWILNNRAHWVHFCLTTGDLSLFLYILGVATYRIPTIQVARDLRRRSCIDGVHMDCVMVRLLKKLLQSLQQFLNINIPWILVHLVTRTTIRILDKLRGL